jgi:putative transposase
VTETVTVLSEQTQMTTSRACELVGLPRSTYYRVSRGYRHYQPVTTPVPQAARFQPAALTPAERDQIIAVLTQVDTHVDPDDEAVEADLSVQQVYWRAFDAGLLSCSQRTFYRVAGRHQLVGDRRRGGHGRRGSHGRRPPAAAAARPNQLWSWDATELSGPGRERYKLMLVVDVYSRFPVGWRIEYGEAIPYALDLFATAIERHGVPSVVHADNGSVMRSHDLIDQLHDHGIVTSYSRPRASDDNPFSESMFKTIKYDPSCPDRFDSIDHARAWTAQFLVGYATGHRHSGLGHYTPAAVYLGTVDADRARRQAQLDRYWHCHPERFRRPPQAPTITTTGINAHLLSQEG